MWSAALNRSRSRGCLFSFERFALGGETQGDWGRECRLGWAPALPPCFCEFRAGTAGAIRGGRFHPIVARRAGGPDSSPQPAPASMNMLTATITPSATLTAFDHAHNAAIFAGWEGRAAFDAVCVMLASGMTETQIELAFLDCRKRVQ